MESDCTVNAEKRFHRRDGLSSRVCLFNSIVFPSDSFYKNAVFFGCVIVVHSKSLTGHKQFIQPRHRFIRHWRKGNIDIIIFFHETFLLAVQNTTNSICHYLSNPRQSISISVTSFVTIADLSLMISQTGSLLHFPEKYFRAHSITPFILFVFNITSKASSKRSISHFVGCSSSRATSKSRICALSSSDF